MFINNNEKQQPKIIGLVMLIVGFGVLSFWWNALYKTIIYPMSGSIAQAKVIGYKVSHNGARMVTTHRKLSGRSPYFEFVSDNQTIKSYSKSPQLFMLFNYEINEK